MTSCRVILKGSLLLDELNVLCEVMAYFVDAGVIVQRGCAIGLHGRVHSVICSQKGDESR
jgi:hypothetical protein